MKYASKRNISAKILWIMGEKTLSEGKGFGTGSRGSWTALSRSAGLENPGNYSERFRLVGKQ